MSYPCGGGKDDGRKAVFREVNFQGHMACFFDLIWILPDNEDPGGDKRHAKKMRAEGCRWSLEASERICCFEAMPDSFVPRGDLMQLPYVGLKGCYIVSRRSQK